MNEKLLQHFKIFIKDESLVQSEDKIILAVSGGYDSIVLLDLFFLICSEFNLQFVIAHVNHCLRGSEADNDEEFVRRVALNHNIQFFSKKADVKQYAKRNQLSIEQAARDIRLGYLNSLRRKIDFDKIALGHNADDRAETVIMNLIKGFGLRGIRSIKPKNNYLIHPLLFATRKEITEYAESRKLDHVEDASNKDTIYLRNKIRHHILPVITQTFGQQTVKSVCRSANILAEIEEYIQYFTERALKNVILSESDTEIVLDINKFLNYFKAIKKSIIIYLLEKMYGEYTYNIINSVLELIERGSSNNKVEIGRKGIIIRYSDKVFFTRKEKCIPDTKLELEKWNFISDCNLKIKISKVKKIESVKHTDRFTEYIDFDTITLPIKIRSWVKGDKFTPLGMSDTKKLQDFFIDEGVVNFKRKRIPILVDASRILWILGYRINDKVKITDKTKNILKMEAEKI